MFKTYLSSTIAMDADVSSDNKYLAFAEVNISGTLTQSNIKVISIEKAKNSKEDPIIYAYNADAGNLILNIKYQNKNKLVCLYDHSIHVIENNADKQISDFGNDSKRTFVDIELNNYVVTVSENKSGLFNTNTVVELTNSSNEKKNTYNLSGGVKEIYCYGSRICVNLGLEVHFIDSNGWLIKEYISGQEIRSIVMSDKIAGIIYKDKIEILNL